MSDSLPIVSIITPAYKCRETIRDTYESVKAQTFSSWEWIVIEDNSQDGTYEYLRGLLSNDPRLTLLRTDKNSGAAVARNLGIEKARGRYIAFLDSDDLWNPRKLELQLRFMEDNGHAFTFTNFDLLTKDGTIHHHECGKEVITYKSLLTKNRIGCLTVIYDVSIIGKVYMPLDCALREDHGAWLDITKRGIDAHLLKECLSVYRVREESVSSRKFRMAKYQYRLYRRHEGFGVIKSLYYLALCTLNRLFIKH